MDNQDIIKQILATVRSDHGLWPKEYSEKDAEKYLEIIEELVKPQLNAKGFLIEEVDYLKAREWAKRVLDVYIQKNPFQGAFVKPLALGIFDTLDSIWGKRSEGTKNDSWL